MLILFGLNVLAGIAVLIGLAVAVWRTRHVGRCQHPGCKAEGMYCFVGNSLNPEYVEYNCWDHANEHGFCRICGSFWGGVESFDFGSHPGICDFCWDELRDDDYYYDCDFDEADLGYFDYPDPFEQSLTGEYHPFL